MRRMQIIWIILYLAAWNVAFHQWFNWSYWNWQQQFRFFLHHESWTLKLAIAGTIVLIFDLKNRKKEKNKERQN